MSVVLVNRTQNPQQSIWAAAHVCYSESPFTMDRCPSEQRAGELVIDRCLKFGHWSVTEFAHLTLLFFDYPHSVPMQVRTHRHLSVQVQSMRYTGNRIKQVADGDLSVESVFYFRPVGVYRDRQGGRYEYTEYDLGTDKDYIIRACRHYNDCGYTEEHARDFLPAGFKQNFIVSGNLRAWLHVLNVRTKKDAQLEIREWAEEAWEQVKDWVPEIADWFTSHLGREKLVP